MITTFGIIGYSVIIADIRIDICDKFFNKNFYKYLKGIVVNNRMSGTVKQWAPEFLAHSDFKQTIESCMIFLVNNCLDDKEEWILKNNEIIKKELDILKSYEKKFFEVSYIISDNDIVNFLNVILKIFYYIENNFEILNFRNNNKNIFKYFASDNFTSNDFEGGSKGIFALISCNIEGYLNNLKQELKFYHKK